MAKTTQTLNGNQLAKSDVLLANGVEDRDTSAENRCIFNRIDVIRDANNSFCAEEYVFCVPSITSDSIDSLIVTHLEHSTLTAPTRVIMT